MTGRSSNLTFVEALAGNLSVFLVLGYAAALNAFSTDLYYRSVQEDEWLEFMTFWAFMLAAAVFVVAALRQRRSTGQLPWFQLGVALFCFVVAMEEISWAQRWLTYRPPAYFLEHNFQQELNVHNVISTDLRKLALKSTILGYGVILPILALITELKKLLSRISIVAPPAALIPAFFATYLIYESYPWEFAGEVVELMLGMGFVAGALFTAARFQAGDAAPAPKRRVTEIAAAFGLLLILGIATAAVSRLQSSADPGRIQAAEIELETLARDFRDRRGQPISKCSKHKRVYTYVVEYDKDQLFDGEFAALTQGGLPEERAAFFIDPWNLPYWYRDRCDRDRGARIAFLYSFGPNRRRDSTRWEILGDDVGVIVYQVGLDR